MDDLYDQFQIQLLSRDDILSRFSINNNSTVTENWKLVLATLTFYSVALAETASTEEGFFTYLHNQETQRKDIPSACRDFIQSMQNRPIELINKFEEDYSSDDEDYSDDDASDDDILRSSHEYCSSNLIAPLDRSVRKYDDIEQSQLKRTHNPPFSWPVGTYSETTSTHRAIGYSDCDVREISSFVFDYRTCDSRVAKISEILGDWNEEPGNWGDCIDGPIEEQIVSPSIIKQITLNLDNFRVKIKETGVKIYEARFTPIRKIHHAASMLARKCAIKWRETKLKPIQIMNKIVLRVIEETPTSIIIETEYMGLDCL